MTGEWRINHLFSCNVIVDSRMILNGQNILGPKQNASVIAGLEISTLDFAAILWNSVIITEFHSSSDL